MCAKHYARWKNGGGPLLTATRADGELLAEITAAAQATGDACVLMNAGASARPRASLDGVEMNAARAVWIIAHGDPGEAHVLHTCHRGNEGCISIRHLYLGDHDRNMLDMVESGRSARGEKNARHILTAKQVQEIRGHIQNDRPYREIAERYGVKRGTISAIHTGKIWSWLAPDAL